MVGVKPPSNQPHVFPAALSKSPMFLPVKYTVLVEAQSSNAGSASPIIVPLRMSVSPTNNVGMPVGAAQSRPRSITHTMSVQLWLSSDPGGTTTPPVCPEIRLIAPGVEGPNVEPNALSNNTPCCA